MLKIGPRLAAGALRIGGSVLTGLADGVERVVGSDPGARTRVHVASDGDAGGDDGAAGGGATYRGEAADGGGGEEAPAAEPAAEVSPARAASNGHGANGWPSDAVTPLAEPAAREQELAAPERGAAAPAHVSEEPVLVEEVADEGAAEGAGPEIHVDEPWDGYAAMKAPEIADRLAAADAAVIAVVELYEAQHRNRRSVLDAAARELRRRDAPASNGG